jgi:hypothetical protein
LQLLPDVPARGMLTGGIREGERALGAGDNLITIFIPALFGLLGWAMLRRQGLAPLPAGCAALLIALAVLIVLFIVVY